MKELSLSEVRSRTLERLGFDSNKFSMNSPEVLARCLRRSASFQCPCSSRDIVSQVMDVVSPIAQQNENLRNTIHDLLEVMIDHGDLQEADRVTHTGPESGILVYLAPPAFIRCSYDTLLLLGTAPHDIEVLPEDISATVEYSNHVRSINYNDNQELLDTLRDLGIIEISLDNWTRCPITVSLESSLDTHDLILSSSKRPGQIEDIEIIDPEATVMYYKRRWKKPGKITGRFIGRRARRFGANLWCYLELKDGECTACIDLPRVHLDMRGCDAAWSLQAAIDKRQGRSQVFRIDYIDDNSIGLELFSPIPFWAQRRWSAIGSPYYPGKCLFAFRFPIGSLESEMLFAENTLSLQRLNSN